MKTVNSKNHTFKYLPRFTIVDFR